MKRKRLSLPKLFLAVTSLAFVWMLFFNRHRAGRFLTVRLQGNDVNSTSHIDSTNLTIGTSPDTSLTRGFDMTLAMHITASKSLLVWRFFCIFLRSVVVFWPREYGTITLIFDAESKQDHDFAAALKAQEDTLGVEFNMKFQPLPEDPTLFRKIPFKRRRGPGYQRQMFNGYFLDLYVDTPIIVLMDADIMFTSPVTPENIFNGEKLRVFGRTLGDNPLRYAARTAIGEELVSNWGFFPTYIWRDTVTNCRNYILKYHNVSRFEEAFLKIHRTQFTYPVPIIMSYAYHFEHDRYDWHIHVPEGQLENYNKMYCKPGCVKPEEIIPDVSVIIHKPYFRQHGRSLSSFEHGYCIALRYVDHITPTCKAFENETDTQLLQYHSPRDRPNGPNHWCNGKPMRKICAQKIESHFHNIAKYYKRGLYDFNLKRVSDVERVAAGMNNSVTCPPLIHTNSSHP